MTRRDYGVFLLVAIPVALGVVYGFVSGPTYTDAYYYLNGANRMVMGQGMTDAAIWTFIGMPESLPTPSHSYWMPLASWTAAIGMWAFNAPLNFQAAQAPFALLLLIVAFSTFWLGGRLGTEHRHAWIPALMVLFGGYYARFWGMPETFTPFAAFGVGALIALGRGTVSKHIGWFALAGALSAGAHLTRADGLLFVIAGGAAIFWFWDTSWTWRERFICALVLVVVYLLAMSPWFIRNVNAIGTPLPTGGTQGIWYTEYNDIFNFPADATPTRFFEIGGWSLLWSSRWTGFTVGLGTLAVVQGFIVLFPFMIAELIRRGRDPFLRPFWIYTLGLHLAMMLVFPFPGYRGGLLHSAAALMPFWTVLGVLGLERGIDWMARRRRWNPRTAKPFFTGFALVLVIVMSGFLGVQGRAPQRNVHLYAQLVEILPGDARLMANDPSAVYYYTGFHAVTVPNEAPNVIPEIAARYRLTHLLVEGVQDGQSSLVTQPLRDLPTNPPAFLEPVPFPDETVRLYRIVPVE
jgi:hypothetical protein